MRSESKFLGSSDTQAKAVVATVEGAQVGPDALSTRHRVPAGGGFLTLLWLDNDMKARTLTVRRSLAQTQNGDILMEPKTAASWRTLTLRGGGQKRTHRLVPPQKNRVRIAKRREHRSSMMRCNRSRRKSASTI